MNRQNIVALVGRQAASEAVAKTGEPPPVDVQDESWLEARVGLAIRAEEEDELESIFRDAWGEQVRRLVCRDTTAATDIGPRLKRLVEESGYSVEEIAKNNGFSRANFYKIFKGSNVTVQRVADILNYLGCTWADLDTPAEES